MQIKSGVVDNDFLVLSGHRLGRFKGDLEQITNFLNENRYLIISVPYKDSECRLGKTHAYQLIYLDSDFLKIENYKMWQEKKGKKGGNSYFCTNQYGVFLTISPSMSWQIWWKIPIQNIKEENKTRFIIIN